MRENADQNNSEYGHFLRIKFFTGRDELMTTRSRHFCKAYLAYCFSDKRLHLILFSLRSCNSKHHRENGVTVFIVAVSHVVCLRYYV